MPFSSIPSSLLPPDFFAPGAQIEKLRYATYRIYSSLECEQGLILFPLFEKKGRKIRGKVSGFFVEFRCPVQTEMFIGKYGLNFPGSFVRLNFIVLVLVSPHCVSRETKVGATFFEILEQAWQLLFCLYAPKYSLNWSFSRSNLLCF